MRSIRARIALKGLILALPTLALLLTEFWIELRADRAAAAAQPERIARLMILRLEDEVSNLRAVLTGLLPAVSAAADAESNDDVLRQARARLPDFVGNLQLFDVEGRNIGTSQTPLADRARIRADDRRYFRGAIATGQFTAGDPVFARSSSRWTINLAIPVVNNGAVVGVLSAGLQLDRINDLLKAPRMPRGTRMMVLNDQGLVVTAFPAGAEAPERDLSQSTLVRRLLADREGSTEAAWPALGEPQFVGFATMRQVPWLVVVGMPTYLPFVHAREILVRGLIFVSLAVLMALLLPSLLAAGLTRRLNRLTADAAAIADGDFKRRTHVSGPDELGRLGTAFNAMLDRLAAEMVSREEAERSARGTRDQLQARLKEIAAGETMLLVGRMAHRAQNFARVEELGAIVQRFAPQILPGIPGALYLTDRATGQLVLLAAWGETGDLMREFARDDCWALRRGQPHRVSGTEVDVTCGHLGGHVPDAYRCVPLVAHGISTGLLHLDTSSPAASVDEHGLMAFAEAIALAVASFRQREDLRGEATHDALTGLFNRRFLDASLERELARAERAENSVGVVMLDIDHFKRFNTEFGHEGGDALLRSLGKLISGQVRKADIACRYGGEEFTVILPGADLAISVERAEAIRQAVKSLVIMHAGHALGAVSVSCGVSAYPAHGLTPAEILGAADEALMRAKASGRDRVMVAGPSLAPAMPANVVEPVP